MGQEPTFARERGSRILRARMRAPGATVNNSQLKTLTKAGSR